MIRTLLTLVTLVTVSTCDRPPAPDSRSSPERALADQQEAGEAGTTSESAGSEAATFAPVEPIDDSRFDPRVAAPPETLVRVLDAVESGQSLDEALSEHEGERDELEGLALYRLGQEEPLAANLSEIVTELAGEEASENLNSRGENEAVSTEQTDSGQTDSEQIEPSNADSESPEANRQVHTEDLQSAIEARIALSALGHLENLDHPLSPWARFDLARLLVPIAPTLALTRIDTLAEERALPRRSELERLKAEALLNLGRTELAIPILRRLLETRGESDAAAAIAMPLARALVEKDGSAREVQRAQEQALTLYRRVATRAPSTRSARRANDAAQALLRNFSNRRRRALEALPLSDRFFEAEAYARGNAHEQAESAYEDIVESLPENHPRRCEALLGQGSAILKQRDRQRGAPFLARVAEECPGPARPWARYKSGRAYVQIGNASRARQQYDALLRENPRHRVADDVLLYRSLLDEEQAPSAFVEGLESLIENYPDGDMRSEAHFRLGMFAFNRGDFDEAARVFWRGRGEGEDAEDVRGRCAYWHARSVEQHLAELRGRRGRSSEVSEAESSSPQTNPITAYKTLIESWPLSYYAQLAMRRLIGRDDEWLLAHLARLQTDTPPLIFDTTDAMESPAFSRVLSLLRMEAFDRAYDELEALELVGRRARQSSVWLSAALFSAAGDLPRATRLVRSRLHAFRSNMPEGEDRARWRLAYPRAFSPLIETAAERAEVPASLVRAIAREESSFNPRAVSWARAYGLVQVILPTARRHGRGMRINADTLVDPQVNLTVGTRFMAWLLERYDGQIALIPPAYNAGHGALDGWLRERGDLPFDEFVDSIPFAETRRYTRRVLQTYGVYSVLDAGQLPELPASVRAASN